MFMQRLAMFFLIIILSAFSALSIATSIISTTTDQTCLEHTKIQISHQANENNCCQILNGHCSDGQCTDGGNCDAGQFSSSLTSNAIITSIAYHHPTFQLSLLVSFISRSSNSLYRPPKAIS